jgi:hypothetical protein
MSTQDKGTIFQEAVEFSEGLRKNGVYLAGDPLHPTSTAITVRMKHGKTVMTDGPFAETEEHLGGYSIVETKDLDEAIAIAARHPLLGVGLSIEVPTIREGPPQWPVAGIWGSVPTRLPCAARRSFARGADESWLG